MAEGRPTTCVYVGPASMLDGRDIVPVTAGTQQLVLVRHGGRIVAAERACPHEGADLTLGRCSEGRLGCPRHLAWFDLSSGEVAGWSFRALRLFPACERAGGIWVEMSEPPR